uniref:Proteasome inhibitor PI31 subunit n=1 Tax=Propithecus coquereli TaxID=379532 RepID=A0A2K6FNI9_PROCO
MAGLEVLFASAAPAISSTQDALVCFLHWEVVTHGYYSLGAGDQEYGTQQVADLTLNLDDYIDAEHLGDFHRTYKNSEELRSRIVSGIITPIHEQWEKANVSHPHREFPPATASEVDPLRIPPHHPHSSWQPPWCDPLGPFAVGGEDLDPFGCRRGGMIVDPLRSGFPRAIIDPSSGLPNRLPPGAVPPGARFDPFGPIGTSPSGPRPGRRGQ